MNIAVLLYDGVTALDAIGPYEVLHRIPGVQIVFVGERAGEIVTDSNSLRLVATRSISETQAPDILVVPGGPGTRDLRKLEPLISWIRDVHERTQWTTSVCTGALLLGAAGVLDGVEATTHWAALESLRQFGACPVSQRFVCAGNIVTAAGVSAGIDMALWLAGEIAGAKAAQQIQLAIEYDPQPPFDSGSPEKAQAEIKVAVMTRPAATLTRSVSH